MNLLKLCLLALVSSAAAASAAPPKVVFIGDYLTYGWTSGFAANPNWINEGLPGMNYPGQTSTDVAARFQSDVVNLHPAIVHILVGAVDAAIIDDANVPIISERFEDNIKAMVQEAKAANIKVILATTPPGGPGTYGIAQMNSIVESYGTANNIQVINYGDALCGCVSSVGGSGIGNTYAPGPSSGPPTGAGAIPLMVATDMPPVPSAAGYALMTQMAETAIATLSGVTLKSGWLDNIELYNENIGILSPVASVNQVQTSATIQFTPYGAYSDGSYQPMLNTSFAGSSGTWTSSDPLVMYVSQTGLTWALSQGTTTISYISPTGVHFSPWIMTIEGPPELQ